MYALHNVCPHSKGPSPKSGITILPASDTGAAEAQAPGRSSGWAYLSRMTGLWLSSGILQMRGAYPKFERAEQEMRAPACGKVRDDT